MRGITAEADIRSYPNILTKIFPDLFQYFRRKRKIKILFLSLLQEQETIKT